MNLHLITYEYNGIKPINQTDGKVYAFTSSTDAYEAIAEVLEKLNEAIANQFYSPEEIACFKQQKKTIAVTECKIYMVG